MPHKTITISEEAYNILVSLKAEGESFTQLIERTATKLKEKPLSSFAGRWEGTPKELGSILAEVERMWKSYDETRDLRS